MYPKPPALPFAVQPPQRPARRDISHVLILMLVACLTLLVGCEPEVRVKREAFAELRAMADQAPPPARAARPQRGPWAIALSYHRGPDRRREAQLLMRQVQETYAIADLWIEADGDTDVLYAGSYRDAYQREAATRLTRLRELEVDGLRPFEYAEITLVSSPQDGAMSDPMNLRQHQGLYSLQVGFFDNMYPGDRRQAAVAYARQLRSEGAEAYYYHGAHRSLVTVGLFQHEQAFMLSANPLDGSTRIEVYTEAVRKLQERFPHNLANGYTLIQRSGLEESEQESALVRVF